ncbi:Rho GTPase-activating protein 32, partial [Ophiophagus hannah]
MNPRRVKADKTSLGLHVEKPFCVLAELKLQGKSWIVKRSYEDFRVLDKHLHLCIYDRRFSQLSELPRSDALKDNPEVKQ